MVVVVGTLWRDVEEVVLLVMKGISESGEALSVCAVLCFVAQSCPTLCKPVGCSLPGSSVHGILQTRILQWVAMPFSRGSSQPRD